MHMYCHASLNQFGTLVQIMLVLEEGELNSWWAVTNILKMTSSCIQPPEIECRSQNFLHGHVYKLFWLIERRQGQVDFLTYRSKYWYSGLSKSPQDNPCQEYFIISCIVFIIRFGSGCPHGLHHLLWKTARNNNGEIENHLASTLIARFMGPTWVPSGADRTQVGPMLAPIILSKLL